MLHALHDRFNLNQIDTLLARCIVLLVHKQALPIARKRDLTGTWATSITGVLLHQHANLERLGKGCTITLNVTLMLTHLPQK